jgi:hypothetical protein
MDEWNRVWHDFSVRMPSVDYDTASGMVHALRDTHAQLGGLTPLRSPGAFHVASSIT